MRRRDFLYGGAALLFGTSIVNAAGGWSLVQPKIDIMSGVGSLHRLSNRFVVNGLGGEIDNWFYTRLITEPPNQQIFTDLPADTTGHTEAFQRRLRETNFSEQFLLLIEARMSVENRYGIYGRSFPKWTGWDTVSFPVYTDFWGDIEPDADANELVYTTLIRYRCDNPPTSGQISIYRDFASDVVRQHLPVSSNPETIP